MNRDSLVEKAMDIEQGNISEGSSSGLFPLEEEICGMPETSFEPPNAVEVLSASAAASEHVHERIDVGTPEAWDLGTDVLARESDGPDPIMSLRSYQREMFEQSIRRNVIVTMDTGTGKTRVAVMRIQAELERSDECKLVWFLAPKVALCEQQYDVIKKFIPAATTTLLTGNEAVDTWKPNIWEAVLGSTHIVVSTPQVLIDALDHAFISMARLALIVMDEAHNAAKKSPYRRIMTESYHPQKAKGLPVPSILGLTASPSMNSTEEQLFELEHTLDALCISPTKHREELLQHTNRPQVNPVLFTPAAGDTIFTPSMKKLRRIYRDLDITADPYVLKLKADPTDKNLRKLEEAVISRSTWTQKQVRGLLERSKVVHGELGPWAADCYLYTNIKSFLDGFRAENIFFDATWPEKEKQYLKEALGRDWIQPAQTPSVDELSDKCRKLIQTLLEAGEHPVGIIFAKDRVIVTMLKEVLSSCSSITVKYRIGTQVGANTWTGRTRELFEMREQTNTLPDFISGKVNLMIATSVLEEGIDIPACNIVICFNKPYNTKSFIQQRGRARKTKSRLVLFYENTSQSHLEWEAAEATMKRIYEDEDRKRASVQRIETGEGVGEDVYIVPETGARLDFENSKSHLQHFCAVLARGDYIDANPDYITTRDVATGNLTCVVLLPSFVAPSLRRAKSRRAWQSEKNATKDAAFQAYKALHLAGWLNDNLLPLRPQSAPDLRGVQTREAIVQVDQLLCPWESIAKLWQEGGLRWKYPLTCHDETGSVLGEYVVVLPLEIVPPGDITVYVESGKDRVLRFGRGRLISASESTLLPDHTSTLLGLHFKHRWHMEERAHVIQVIATGTDMALNGIGGENFEVKADLAKSRKFLVRDREGCPLIYEGMISAKPTAEQVQYPFYEMENAPEDVPYLHLSRWTKRSDFLHPVHGIPGKDALSTKPYKRVYPVPWARVDTIPLRHAEFGMLLPSLIHELEVMMLVQTLSRTLLKEVQISDLELVRQAVSSRSAVEPHDYEKLEFLGDSILKYCTSVQLCADHLDWPEGYLSFAKDRIVSNSRLSKAALDTGLAKFILTKPFTGQKWRPLYLAEALKPRGQPNARRLPTKMLADVVEALIGASFVDGGLPKALQCVLVFIREVQWRDVSIGRDMLLRAARKGGKNLGVIAPIQELIGYEFETPSLLLEALTHGSYIADSEGRSWERLEFLGDAVLDYIIVTRLYHAVPKLTHSQMHMLKTALVNNDFLAYLAMETRLNTVRPTATTDGDLEEHVVEKPLWMFMRHSSSSLGEDQKAAIRRHEMTRAEVNEAIIHGTHYPWALLARLELNKFYSDLVEALLGAVWIDSGSIEICEMVLTKLSILPYMERMLRDNVHVQHPKEELTKAAISEKIEYVIDLRVGEASEKEWLCKIHLGGRVIASVEGALNKEEAKTKAAAEALNFLNAERGVVI